MSNNTSFRCPVCRARQTLRDQCRRCEADLRLIVRIHLRAAFLLGQRQQALADGDRLREQTIAAELMLLSPKLYQELLKEADFADTAAAIHRGMKAHARGEGKNMRKAVENIVREAGFEFE